MHLVQEVEDVGVSTLFLWMRMVWRITRRVFSLQLRVRLDAAPELRDRELLSFLSGL